MLWKKCCRFIDFIGDKMFLFSLGQSVVLTVWEKRKDVMNDQRLKVSEPWTLFSNPGSPYRSDSADNRPHLSYQQKAFVCMHHSDSLQCVLITTMGKLTPIIYVLSTLDPVLGCLSIPMCPHVWGSNVGLWNIASRWGECCCTKIKLLTNALPQDGLFQHLCTMLSQNENGLELTINNSMNWARLPTALYQANVIYWGSSLSCAVMSLKHAYLIRRYIFNMLCYYNDSEFLLHSGKEP